MPKVGQRGIVHILLLILLVAGIALGIYLIQTRTNILPHAASDPIGPKAGFTLTSLESVPPGGEFYAKVMVNSDFDAANLFTLVLNYPADKVEFLSVSPSLDEKPAAGTFIKKWIEQTDDKNGTVTLSGAVPNPGFQTSEGNPASMAVINFKVKPDLGGLPNGDIPLIISNESGIYRNSDNQNIIGTNEGTTVKIEAQPSVAPSGDSSPSPSSSPSEAPVGSKRVFITSSIYPGDLGGFSGADQKCQQNADSAGLVGQWKAWLGNYANPVTSRLEHSQGQYQLLNGVIIADNWTDLLDGSLKAPIDITEKNQQFAYSLGGVWGIWTGTASDGIGTLNVNCKNWTSSEGTEFGTVGSASTDSRWTFENFSLSCATPKPLYCFEQGSSISSSPSPSPAPVPVDGKRADLYNDPRKPNFVNDQDVSVFFTKCAEEGIELFGQPASVQPVCDINDDGTINSPDWAILIKFRNTQI